MLLAESRIVVWRIDYRHAHRFGMIMMYKRQIKLILKGLNMVGLRAFSIYQVKTWEILLINWPHHSHPWNYLMPQRHWIKKLICECHNYRRCPDQTSWIIHKNCACTNRVLNFGQHRFSVKGSSKQINTAATQLAVSR